MWDLTRRRLSDAVDRELAQLDRDAARKAKEARKRCGVRTLASPDAVPPSCARPAVPTLAPAAATVSGTVAGDVDAQPRGPARAKPHETVLVQIAVTAETLGGLDDEPGQVCGPPIPGGTARDLVLAALAGALAPGATVLVERLLTCPVSGVLTDISPRYTATTRQRSFCFARDGASRFPTGGAALAELDHVRCRGGQLPDFTARGGPTTVGDLKSLGVRDHQVRHRPGWDVTGDAHGILTWTTPTGPSHASRTRAVTRPRFDRQGERGSDGEPPF